ncbi:MAG TPA: glycosyltransferase family 4 protein [Gammaproteobacteria bacterium]
MRVLCVVPSNVIHETDQFIGLKNKGVDIHVVTTKIHEPDYSKLIAAGIPVHTIPLRGRLDQKAIAKIRKLMAQHKFDIVHAFNNKTVANALIAAKGFPVRFIAYRGIVGNVSFFNPGSWMTYLNPRVDRIICVAEAIRRYLLDMKFLWLKIPPYKPVTIYKGHDLRWYRKQPHDLAEFDIPSNAFVVACTTNFRPRKGIDVLIEAFNRLPREPDIRLLLIGNMDAPKLRKLIQRNKNRDRITLTGYRKDAPEITAACNACILPSIKREGLPKTIIEGMAYGVPPIVTNSGGSPELVEPDISGLVVPPKSPDAIANAILFLHRNPEQARQMGEAARERIRTAFNIQDTIEKTFALYHELLPDKKV